MRFHRESASSSYDAIVVGSGIAGLSAAALLSRAGRRVLVVERHDRPGGYAHAFRRGRHLFDSAIHLVGGAGEGPGLIRQLLSAVGAGGACEFRAVDPVYTASYPGLTLDVAGGTEGFVASHARVFGAEAALQELVNVCMRIRDENAAAADTADAMAMVGARAKFETLMRYRRASVADALAELLPDPKLRTVVGTLWPYLGLSPGRLSFVYWAIMLMSYFADGAWYCRGSFQVFANALADAVTSHGGEVLLRSSVRRIRVADGRVLGVTLENGQKIDAPVVLSNADATQTFEELVGADALPSRHMARLRGMRPSVSAACVYAATQLDLPSLGARHETFIFPTWDHERAFATTEAGRPDWLSLTVPSLADPELARSGEHLLILTTLVRADARRDWRDAKQGLTDAMLAAAEQRYPGLGENLTFAEGSTPRTMERYTRNTGGSAYGWELSPAQIGVSRTSQVTPVKGLLLTGHWTQPGGGVAGVAASGVQAARRVLGHRSEAELWRALPPLADQPESSPQ